MQDGHVTLGNRDENGSEIKRRESSDLGFPYVDLDQAIDVPDAINTFLGVKGTSDQLSGALSLKGGAFSRRVAAAKMFGFVSREGTFVVISDLGRRAISDDSAVAASAKVEAFLNVELYKKLYEDFRNARLPADKGLEHHMKAIGVPEKQTETARQIFRRSAKQAGFFNFGEDRLIIPPLKDASQLSVSSSVEQQVAYDESDLVIPNFISTPTPTGTDLDPAITFALKTLPLKGDDWTYEELEDWLDGFKGVLRLVYKVKRPSNF